MATKKTKKIDVKKLAKVDTMNQIRALFEGQDFQVLEGTQFGFTDTTIVVRLDETDIQIKLVTPSAKNGERYLANEEE